ncbi:hypothetical protein Sjap_001131 [Stephania japonica]|uniref:Uncharacterized protein n=1 Tax=Stephania japonica TaxID=461633 RepID=A0AAP0KJD9_9MAGN
MTEVLHSHLPNSGPLQTTQISQPQSQPQTHLSNNSETSLSQALKLDQDVESKDRDKEEDQLSLLALLLTVFRKSLGSSCKNLREEKICSGMEIGWPTDVRHVAHVTFDRFNGFLGLPVEFEPEVPRRAPSASASVFGVSTESMQCSYDSRGNSVPTILLLMQGHLYAQGGLQAEGIFRINAENSQEEHVRELLNSGILPEGVEVHCLAGLIKAWFRELPSGVLDPLEPEQVMQCETEEQCTELVRLLPPTEAALLDWAINLMADVVLEEHHNKMNAHNIAMVFAPNMTQMADPLTALVYAVQVMNFLKTLIARTLKERGVYLIDSSDASHLEPSNDNGHHSSTQPCPEELLSENEENGHSFVADEPILSGNSSDHAEEDDTAKHGSCSSQTSKENAIADESTVHTSCSGEIPTPANCTKTCCADTNDETNSGEHPIPMKFNHLALPDMSISQSSASYLWKGPKKIPAQPNFRVTGTATEKSRESSAIASHINSSRTAWIEAWR